MKINGRLILFTIVLVVLTTACKYFFGASYEWSGFSPVIAIALFSGMIIKRKDYSFLLPLVALLLSDIAIQVLYQMNKFDYPGFYGGQWKNYMLLLLTATLIGWLLKGRKYSSVFLGGIIAPTLFFLASNFSVWLSNEVMYTRDFAGLMNSYVAGLPFYKNALLATLVFLPVILVSYNYLAKQKNSLVVA